MLNNWAFIHHLGVLIPQRGHAGEQKVCQVSGYEWDSNSEAESIKDVDNMISPPTRCTRSND